MKKYNSLLMIGLISSVMGSLTASQDMKQSFVESTKEDLKIASILYAEGYGVAHGVGSLGFALAHAHIEADFERWQAKQNGEKISFKKTANTFTKEFKDAFGYVNKRIIPSHRVAAPAVIIGVVAHNLYKQANS
jgi:hypothetical protein